MSMIAGGSGRAARAGSDAASRVADGSLADAILHVIERIEEVVREEQSLVSRFNFIDIETLVARKSHLALELSRVMEHAGDVKADVAVRRALARLNSGLVENANLLRRHMEAAGEITAIIGQAIESASDDGTYSARPTRTSVTTWSR